MSELTPTEDLLLNVLVARQRLGEGHWTFGRRFSRQVVSLCGRGLIEAVDHGGDWWCSLTPSGREEAGMALDWRDAPTRARMALADGMTDASGSRFWGEIARCLADGESSWYIAKLAERSVRKYGRLIPPSDWSVIDRGLRLDSEGTT